MKRYPEEFKIEAVKQITERNYPIGEVAKRLGCTIVPQNIKTTISSFLFLFVKPL